MIKNNNNNSIYLILLMIGVLILILGCDSNHSRNSKKKSHSVKETEIGRTTKIEAYLEKSAEKIDPSLSRTLQKDSEVLDASKSVDHIHLNVLVDNHVLVAQQPLIAAPSGWQTILSELPMDVLLTFQSLAYDAQNKLLFSGSTSQILRTDSLNSSVKIVIGRNLDIKLPALVSLHIPRSIPIHSNIGIEAIVEGPAEQKLDYQITSPEHGGEVSPSSGILTPLGNGRVTLLQGYTAPETPGLYTHQWNLSNQRNFSVKYQFTTLVTSPNQSSSVEVVVSPSVTQFHVGPRIASDLQFHVEVDVSPLSLLTFQWNFRSENFPQVHFINAQTPSPILQNYQEQITGIIELFITDSHQAVTKVTYQMPVRQFPDCLINCDVPQANAGPDQGVEVGSTVQLDGSQSVDPLQRNLIFQWIMVSQPAGAAAVLNQDHSAKPSFVASIAGTYWLTLWTNNQILSDTDSVRINVTPTPQSPPSEKPTIVIESLGSSQYQLKLSSPKSYQNSPLIAVSHLGLKCNGLTHGTGIYQINPSVFSFREHHSLSMIEADPKNRTTLPMTDLYSFECQTSPQLFLGSATTIAYVGHPPLMGNTMIGIENKYQ